MTVFRLQSFTLILLIGFSCLTSVHAVDIKEGEKKATLCMGCHGADGISEISQYPSLAGQRASYLETQLKAFQSGQRINSMMQSMATKLTIQDIKNLAAYYSSLPSKKMDQSVSVEGKGQSKFAMCAGCHGSNAQGRGRIPKLAGQPVDYLKKQLLDFKKGVRKGGPMNPVSSSLSEQDINELAVYLASL